MDTREYIDSGILDLYSTGVLSTEEMRDVELMACQFPDIKTELQNVQYSIEKYAMKFAMVPPAGLKERVLSEIDRTEIHPHKKIPVVIDIAGRKKYSVNFLVAASIALIIVAAAFAIKFARQSSNYKAQVAQLSAQESSREQEMKNLRQNMSGLQQQIAVLDDPQTVRVTMKGTPKSPESMAMIYWNTKTRIVYLDVKKLPPTPANMQYELWFIDPSNKPVSAGMFDAGSHEMLRMVDAPSALAFAVTLEPMGGSPQPTMDQMYVMGTVNS